MVLFFANFNFVIKKVRQFFIYSTNWQSNSIFLNKLQEMFATSIFLCISRAPRVSTCGYAPCCARMLR